MYLNKVLLYGNLTRDPEIKALPSGQNVANFGVATNRIYKDKEGQKKELTEFHNIVAFGRTADIVGQYMKKGKGIYIEGRIQTRSWETDGKKNYRTEIVVENFQFGPGGQGTGGGVSRGDETEQKAPVDQGDSIQYPDEEINPEDIPF